jgi:hypothetical protein
LISKRSTWDVNTSGWLVTSRMVMMVIENWSFLHSKFRRNVRILTKCQVCKGKAHHGAPILCWVLKDIILNIVTIYFLMYIVRNSANTPAVS